MWNAIVFCRRRDSIVVADGVVYICRHDIYNIHDGVRLSVRLRSFPTYCDSRNAYVSWNVSIDSNLLDLVIAWLGLLHMRIE